MTVRITSRSANYSQWYLDVIREAQLAENSDVRGCMVIRPSGYAIWERMQRALDRMFRETGHENAYFPLFIPKSFLEREEEMAEGFAKECAVVTHYRLIATPGGGLEVDPEARLDEPLIVRPTSETIIWNCYRKWIQSYRDLPILINQWANVVRWEMRTRLFLRTAEFLWQEGHTAHATSGEAEAEAATMLEVYRTFAEEWMAMPVLVGRKSEGQRFPGAVHTLSIEALMQDGKALQAGTSHFLGQNFARAFDVTFQSKEGSIEHAWATSWGVSTRLVGGLIMSHSDDHGLVLPPRLAPTHVVIVPIYKTEEERALVLEASTRLATELKSQPPTSWLGDERLGVKVDDRDNRQPGFKFTEWEARGVPVRVEIGPRDVAQRQCVVARRDLPGKEGKTTRRLDEVGAAIPTVLRQIQESLFARAKEARKLNTHEVNSWEDFKAHFDSHGGFVWAHWDGTTATEERIAAETKATIRCIPEALEGDRGKCILTGAPSVGRVPFAKAY